MKFNVEVEIGWCGEDGIDAELLHKVQNKIADQIMEKFGQDVDKELAVQVRERMDNHLDTLLEGFLDNKYSVRDKWGKVIKEDVSPREILTQKLDDFMEELVDESGKRTFGAKTPRYQQLMDRTAAEHIDRFMKDVARQVVSCIKKDMNEKAKETIVTSIMKDYDLKKLLNLNC